MNKVEILSLVRKLIADEQATGFTEGGNLEEPEGTQELLNYLDRAVDEYSIRQVANKDLRFVKRMTVVNGMDIPTDFLSFCGAVPINIENKKLYYYGEMSTLPVRYYARLPYVTAFGTNEELPYEYDQYMSIAALAAIYSLNKHEFNVSQDLMLWGYGAASNGNSQQ